MIINRHGIYYIPRITKQRNLCRLLFRPLAHTKENYNYPTNFKPLRSYQEFRISPRRNSLEFARLFPSSQRALTHRFTSTQRVQRSTPSSPPRSTNRRIHIRIRMKRHANPLSRWKFPFVTSYWYPGRGEGARGQATGERLKASSRLRSPRGPGPR